MLQGQYPSGVIDWGRESWKVCPPAGRMSTFSLCAAAPQAAKAQFHFFYPRVLTRFDVYNPLGQDVTLTIRAPEMRERTFSLKAGQLQRIRTGWMNRASEVSLKSDNLAALRFDNLAYSPYIWARVDWSE